MLIINLPATRARIEERCIMLVKVSRKYGINKTSFSMFLRGKFFGTSGKGEYGRCEQALIDMDLLVYEEVDDERQAA